MEAYLFIYALCTCKSMLFQLIIYFKVNRNDKVTKIHATSMLQELSQGKMRNTLRVDPTMEI